MTEKKMLPKGKLLDQIKNYLRKYKSEFFKKEEGTIAKEILKNLYSNYTPLKASALDDAVSKYYGTQMFQRNLETDYSLSQPKKPTDNSIPQYFKLKENPKQGERK